MRTLSPSELLDVCDLGDGSSPAGRAVLLLDAADARDDDADGDPRDWPLGLVNGALLRLRAQVFGPRLEVLANCPQCAAICESALDCLAIAASAPRRSGPFLLAYREELIGYRLPTPADVMAAADCAATPAHALARRILLDSDAVDAPGLAGALALAVAEADPLAQIELALHCPECAARWTEPLHVIDILWAELRNFATRLTIDIARLAQAFGWREADILAMSPRRRQRYLALLPT
ncbi:hypothetical protein WOC76_19935 [Methylocystis sp. IM3]|jgi:hypothetical protein|uniref:hypothetical protein n=1 Tax=unclassified Methylocystis TaxID=2625913 RepID=UPI0030F8E65B